MEALKTHDGPHVTDTFGLASVLVPAQFNALACLDKAELCLPRQYHNT